MNTPHAIFVALFSVALATSATASMCRGTAKYKIVFFNKMTADRFSRANPDFPDFPKDGLNFSPMTAVTHDPRVSLFTIRGFASPGLEMVCETGANANLMNEAKALRRRVTSVVGGTGGIPARQSGSVVVTATCDNYYLTVTSMIAPSPDWIVQINNMPLMKYGKFVKGYWGKLVAYDCGTDSGRDFTPPSNPRLDIPTEPKDNIVRLSEDETDRFDGRVVGYYKVYRM